MPEVLDSGEASRILRALEEEGWEVEAFIQGTMGRTAVLDNYLEDKVKATEERPSECLRRLMEEFDYVVVATDSPSPRKAAAFCWLLIEKVGGPLKPVVLAETSSKSLMSWGRGGAVLAEALARRLGYSLVEPPSFGETRWTKDGRKYRRLLAVDVGDLVMINGVVVGVAKSSDVILCEEGGVLRLEGVEVKEEGLRKLGPVDLWSAKVDTCRSLRRTRIEPRVVAKGVGRGVALIDHAGRSLYEYLGRVEGFVSVGDDTTRIVADLAYRFNSPVLGLVDGDLDGLLSLSKAAQGSLLIKVVSDDEAGEEVKAKVFKGAGLVDRGFDEVKSSVIELLRSSGKLLEVAKLG